MRRLSLLLSTVIMTVPAMADEYQAGTQPRTIPGDMMGPSDNQLTVNLVTEDPTTGAAYVQYNVDGGVYSGHTTFGGTQLERASYCLGCHIADTLYSPGRTWAGSMMANAARDPLFYGALAIANQDLPGVGGDYCLRCHSPVGFTQGHTMQNPPQQFGGRPIAADSVNNPNRYPCNQYEPGSMTLCKCLAANNDCSSTPTMRDYCTESDPNRIANGYCMINFGDNLTAGFKGHPDSADYYHDEAYEQLYTGQKFRDNLTEEDVNGTADPADDAEGLQCAFCHRIDPNMNGTTRVFGGNFYLSNATVWPGGADASNWAAPRTVRFGPYAQTYTNCSDPNNASTCDTSTGSAHRHGTQQSLLHTQGNFCGICHDVTNPVLKRLNPNGTTYATSNFPSGFNMPIERTYSEWHASDFRTVGTPGSKATDCQGCHMTQAPQPTAACIALGGGGTNIYAYNRPAPGAGTLSNPGMAQHTFTGGNVWMPSVFRDVMAPTGVSGDPAWLYNLVNIADNNPGNVQRQQQQAYNRTAQAAQATLQSAATLALLGTPPSSGKPGDIINFSVRITNNTGHKLPTGYPEGRRMWLQVSAAIPSDPSMPPPFFQSGAWNASTGALTRDNQLKIYEVALGVMGASVEPYPTQFHFAKNQILFQDNRIPPSGFDPSDPNFDQMAPVIGGSLSSYPVQGNGKLPNWDDSSYTFTIPTQATGDVAVSVSLLYQTASDDYINFLSNGNTTNNRGNDLRTVWMNHEKSPPVVMAQQMFTVTNTMPYVPPIVGDMSASVIDLSASAVDMTNGPGDLAVPLNPGYQGPGCVWVASVAGADFRDLGPLALLLVAGVILSRRRHANTKRR
jgi:hypothetical protein